MVPEKIKGVPRLHTGRSTFLYTTHNKAQQNPVPSPCRLFVQGYSCLRPPAPPPPHWLAKSVQPHAHSANSLTTSTHHQAQCEHLHTSTTQTPTQHAVAIYKGESCLFNIDVQLFFHIGKQPATGRSCTDTSSVRTHCNHNGTLCSTPTKHTETCTGKHSWQALARPTSCRYKEHQIHIQNQPAPPNDACCFCCWSPFHCPAGSSSAAAFVDAPAASPPPPSPLLP